MGYYDIGEKYEEGKPLTYISLCKEIMDEYENATGCTPPGEETIRDKFKNAQESGLINKLNKLLGYNIKENIVALGVIVLIHGQHPFQSFKIKGDVYAKKTYRYYHHSHCRYSHLCMEHYQKCSNFAGNESIRF